MRRAPFLVMLLLLFCAGPLLAQSPGVIPMPQQSKAKLAKKHLKHKAVATKPAATKSAKTKSAASKPAEPKPVRRRRAAGKSPATGKPGMVKNAIEARKAKEAKAEPAKTKTEPEAKSEAPSDVFAGTPQGERQKIQDALAWSGDYTGTAGGDDSMLTAIKNFQKRHKAKVTGILAPSERADLLAAAKQHEDEFGWSVVVDPATGIRIGLPTKLVTQAHDAGRGTRWSSKHGEVQVETFRIKDANLKLADLFEKMKKEPAMRKVETSVLHDDNFFISGLQGLKLFAVRAKMRNGEVRGFTVMYDQMMETIVAPVMGAMANTFSPFPERSAPFAALAKSVEYGNGLVVSAQGHIVTDVQTHARLPGDRRSRPGQRRPRGRGPRQRPRAIARLWRAQDFAAFARTRGAQNGRADAGRHSRSERARRRPQVDRGQGAACRRQRDRIAPAGADGGIFRRRRARRKGSGPRHYGNGPRRARQRRSGRAAGAAGFRRDHQRLP